MESILVYAKGLAASVGSILTAIIVGLPAIGVEVPQWLAIVSVVVTAVAVVVIPNKVSEQDKAEIIVDAVEDPSVPVAFVPVTSVVIDNAFPDGEPRH